MFFRKKNQYHLNMDSAGKSLDHIFSSCNLAPNTVPIDKLLLRQKVNSRSYNRLLVITTIVAFLTFITPLAIIPVVELTADYFMPVPVDLSSHYVEDDVLHLTFVGDNIQYRKAYMVDATGIEIPALSYDKKSKTICFPFLEGKEFNIYIPVENDATVHLLLSPIYN